MVDAALGTFQFASNLLLIQWANQHVHGGFKNKRTLYVKLQYTNALYFTSHHYLLLAYSYHLHEFILLPYDPRNNNNKARVVAHYFRRDGCSIPMCIAETLTIRYQKNPQAIFR